ncbi:MAG: hypothetical protein K6G88_11070 [Lachnospiraceae bacterium]|nr:hypothetical protein [Lachnospiraceae bacterium]
MDYRSVDLDKMSQNIKDKYFVNSGSMFIEKSKEKIKLEDFKEALANKTSMKIRFTSVLGGKLTMTCSAYKVQCDVSEWQGNTAYIVKRDVEVLVTDIDETENIVTVSIKEAQKKVAEQRRQYASEIDAEIDERIKKGETVVLPAKIVKIVCNGKFSFAILQILGSKVIGRILAKDWAPNYVSNLKEVCHVGEWYDVEVVSRRQNSGYDNYWDCSRVSIAEDPWKTQNFDERFKKGDLLSVKCVSIDKSETWFWGECEDVKGIQLFCDMPQKFKIQIGQVYPCMVKHVDSSQRMFKVVPINIGPDKATSSDSCDR